MAATAIKTVGIVGAGIMGQGIAQVFAVAGYDVLLYDIQPERISAGLALIRKNMEAAVEKGKLSAAQKDEANKRINSVNDFRYLQVDLAIESVIEKLEVKQKILQELEKNNSTETILATNTSSIPVTQIAAVLKHPKRFAGLHFFNPAPAMKLVEIIKGASTQETTVNTLRALVENLGKVSVLANDSPGFIVNRVARHFYVESLQLLEENVASVETIDTLMRSTGFKMGPFELMDLIGIDTNFSVTNSIYHSFHQDSKFRPSRLQQQKVDAGHHGRKSGKGFYDYTTKS
ncbi:MAG: 3-hydroxybutyryl-CoA dehydrogenase [Cyclobacteriaceae bacterium]|nr:3-hydroxybutyryl-CoA dehydrogenase [Cyclobacteriaceae bacterium]